MGVQVHQLHVPVANAHTTVCDVTNVRRPLTGLCDLL